MGREAKIIGIGREVVAMRKDKSIFPMELGISEMEVDGRRMFVGLIRDITARKEAEKQLYEARENAERASLAKSEFLATMSHEIRTPLNGILGMAELLSHMELNEKEDRYVNTILSSGELLLVLINDVLDFSKIEAGELELEKIPVVINTLLTEIVQLLSSRASENNVELVVKCPQDIPQSIMTDPVRLRQILINLVGNAIKFTKEGYVSVNVSKRYLEGNKIGLRFEVVDTGIGIPKDKISSIFEQFSQADSTTTRKFGGTGLGLAICKKLIALMGGKIGVGSIEGKGSTFWFELDFDVHTSAKADNAYDLKNISILLVDDYEVNLEVYQEYLRNINIESDTATSAAIGLDKLRKQKILGNPYDVVIVDYSMPGMDGITMAEVIKHEPSKYGDPQLVLLTALDKSEGLKEVDISAFCQHLIKPVYPNVMFETIASAMVLREKPEKKKSSQIVLNSPELDKSSINALVVDDFPSNVEVAKEMLEKAGCVVTTAVNGSEALDALKNDPAKFDIIFLDCQMPVMDGFTTTRIIRKSDWGKEIPIIAVTANTIKEARQKCLDSGMNDYISKPMKISNISDMLDKYLDKRPKVV
ncbi:MAG: Signal transduction histidine kinaselike protein [Rickettsiaceae bacterium]|nr:Signal transduction histidine kinaselike protein [Rickettsiaceae bacterium]